MLVNKKKKQVIMAEYFLNFRKKLICRLKNIGEGKHSKFKDCHTDNVVPKRIKTKGKKQSILESKSGEGGNKGLDGWMASPTQWT